MRIGFFTGIDSRISGSFYFWDRFPRLKINFGKCTLLFFVVLFILISSYSSLFYSSGYDFISLISLSYLDCLTISDVICCEFIVFYCYYEPLGNVSFKSLLKKIDGLNFANILLLTFYYNSEQNLEN